MNLIEANQTLNLIEGIQTQANRCRELVKACEEIGPAGVFARAVYESAIAEGEAAIASGDAVRMLRAYKALEGCE